MTSPRYLTPEEEEERGPQGMIGTAILSEYQEPVEEIIFHDKLYGKSISETLNLLASQLDNDGCFQACTTRQGRQ